MWFISCHIMLPVINGLGGWAAPAPHARTHFIDKSNLRCRYSPAFGRCTHDLYMHYNINLIKGAYIVLEVNASLCANKLL